MMMVDLKRTLLTAVMVLGISLSVFAQKGNDNSNQRPEKGPPPKVVVKEKDPKPQRPNQDKRDDKKGKP